MKEKNVPNAQEESVANSPNIYIYIQALTTTLQLTIINFDTSFALEDAPPTYENATLDLIPTK